MELGVRSERGNASSSYDLLARLAAGGMAEIFLARANSLAGLERYVVLKRIRPERGDDPRWVTMFLDEARLAAQLQHANIAQVFDLGRIGEDYFYTMEYVHGEDVLDILERSVESNQRIPINVALAIVAGAAAGLAHAHERCGADGRPLGIVHRDISPSNLMVSYEGTVKVVDFGVAKARFRRTETQAGTIMGKIAYLSPEQTRTQELDARSDIFSLGIVLYEMVCQRRLFKRDTDYETLRAVANDAPTPPSQIVKNLPPGLDALILKMLAKDPAERFQSMNELIDALEEVAEKGSLTISPGVLRRYMRELFGAKPEPWRDLEKVTPIDDDIEILDESSRPRTAHGFPLDAKAEEVPLLAHTGLIDIEALFGTGDVLSSSPRPAPGVQAYPHVEGADDLPTPLRISTSSHELPPRAMSESEDLPTPLRVATGSVENMPTPDKPVPAPKSGPREIPPPLQPSVRSTPPTAMPIVGTQRVTPLPQRSVPTPAKFPKRLITIIATVAILCAIALAVYPLLQTTPAKPKASEPTVEPIVEPAPPPPTVAPSPTVETPAVAAPTAKKTDKKRSSTAKKTDTKSDTKTDTKADTKSDKPADKTKPKPTSPCTDPLDCQF